MRNKERLEFIKSLIKSTDIQEFLTVQDAMEEGIVEMGANCKIQSGAILGTDGFGYERDETGKLIKFPHLGKVKIGDDVHINGPTVVCRGSIGDTVIGSGTRIAGNCQIGHNVNIGRHCLIGPGVILSGSCKIRDYVTINAKVLVDHAVEIGQYSEIGACSYVRQNVPEKCLWYGTPALLSKKDWSTV